MKGNRNLRAWVLVWMCCLCLLTSACRTQVAQAPEEPALTPSRAATPMDVAPTLTPDAPEEEIVPPSAPRTAVPTASSPAADAAEYTVQPGDTLLGIASTYGVPMAAIQLQNDMGSSTVVQAGQILVMPSREAWAGASRFWIVHVVAPGETLSDIARAYDLTVQAIQQVNDLTDADLIVAGRELVIPLEAPSVTRLPATPRPEPTATSPPVSTATPMLTATASTVVTETAAISAAISAAESTETPISPPPDDVSAWPRETARLINVVREQHGLPPLIYNETLAQAAQGQANDCAQRGWCSHTGSDGSNIKTRVLRAGYDAASWAECWAQRQTPQGAVDIWMDEVPPNDPHRRTLLTTWLSEIGLGIAKTDWGYYFIANFGRPN